jgi:hypothetical protein
VSIVGCIAGKTVRGDWNRKVLEILEECRIGGDSARVG